MIKTKIVCTIGPASNSYEKIEKLIQGGMDVARLNFSHGSHEKHHQVIENIRQASLKTNESVAILQDLGEEKISKLLVNLSLPATIGMMVTALYNLVDTIFVGRGVGAIAIGGLTIAFPIQMVIMAFAQMIGIGAASAISRSLGAKDIEKADYIAGNSFLCVIVLSSTIAAIGLIFTEPMLRLFGSTETILPYAKDYITIILWGSIFFSFAMSSNNLIRAEGNAKVAMATMLIGAILNMILDPIFIFIFKLGIKGAALATIISQFISFLYILKYLYSGKSSLKIKLHHLKPR
ncbi:unnamed protein product, partial [marine sediment metagenome]